jgi:transposase
MVSPHDMLARRLDLPEPTLPSARPSGVRPVPGWRRSSPYRRVLTHYCVASNEQKLLQRRPRDASASTTGPGARGNATAPSSSTSRRAKLLTSYPIATPQLSTSYSRAATEAASQAQQVADRWHLLKNVREAVERLLDRHLLIITEALKPSDPDPGKAEPSPADEPSPALDPVAEETSSNSSRKEAALAKRRRRVERFQQIHELHRQGTPIRQIARDLVLSRKTVRRCLGHEKYPELASRPRRLSGMDEHREWVDARIAEGKINASELHRELAARGVRLSYGTVRRTLTNRLERAGKSRPRVNAAKPKPMRPPSPRQLSFDWVRRPEKRTVEAQARLDKIRTASPDLTTALDLADEFKSLIRKQSSGTLRDWLSRAEASPCSEIRHFAEGIGQDESAVNAAITLSWSNGPVEGHVNRLKTIKRQMYGRAGFTLLRARVMNAA